MVQTPDTTRRRYDTRLRQRRAADTRERIAQAGCELVHELSSWDWKPLTFRAVAQRAGVGERTVYRHFPTERHLRDAVMQQVEREAGVDYDQLDLAGVAQVATRVFMSRGTFAAGVSTQQPDEPAFVSVDHHRQEALLRAVSEAAPEWPERQQRTVAALLDVLWGVSAYERLVGSWDLSSEEAIGAMTWLIDKVVAAVGASEGPPAAAAP